MISTLARREVTVALSGDGGDELFAGYDHYRADRLARRLRRLTGGAVWRMLDRVLDRLPPTRSKKGPINKAKRFAEGVRRPADLEHARWWIFLDPEERSALYAPPLRDALARRDPFAYYRERLAEGSALGYEGLQRRLFADVTGYLADDILVKVDRMSMAVSLEARVPFLDHEVVEYAFAIPAAWKLDGGTTKKVLRDAFADLLPEKILGRGKEGFSIPMKNWLRGPLRPLLHDLLDERRIRGRGWFEPAETARLIDEHLRGRANHAHRLWCLMNLELSIDGLERRVQARGAAMEEHTR
jgi:asparagine synthase (glutamine-hydrolysing)